MKKIIIGESIPAYVLTGELGYGCEMVVTRPEFVEPGFYDLPESVKIVDENSDEYMMYIMEAFVTNNTVILFMGTDDMTVNTVVEDYLDRHQQLCFFGKNLSFEQMDTYIHLENILLDETPEIIVEETNEDKITEESKTSELLEDLQKNFSTTTPQERIDELVDILFKHYTIEGNN